MQADGEARQLVALGNSDDEDIRMHGESGEEEARGEPLPAPRLRLLQAFPIPEPQRQVRKEKTSANLEDLFRCYICLAKVVQPVLCPFCSKISCLSCTKKWLVSSKSECPHCRQTLRVSQLVNGRFVEDVNSAVKDIQTAKPLEGCQQHPDISLAYYCNDCEKPICPECALFSDAHKGHRFGRLQEVYEQHVEKVRSGVQNMLERQRQIHKCREKLENLVSEMTDAKDLRVKEVNQTMEGIFTRLQSALKIRKSRLDQTRKVLEEEQCILHELHQEIHTKLTSLPRTRFIQETEGCIAKINDAHQTDFHALMQEAKEQVPSEFPSELVPGYFSDQFVINDYTRIRQNEEVVFSPPLKMHGLTWRLKVYPNGNGIAQGAYLSVFLEMTEGLLEPSKYEYRVEMISRRAPPIVREFSSDFERGECWGYNRLFKIDNLERDGFLDDDSLKLRYFVRAPSFMQEARDQEVYIHRLEKELEEAHAKIAALENGNPIRSSRLSTGNSDSEEEGIAVREEKSSDSRGDQDQLNAPRLQVTEEAEESPKQEEEDDQVLASPILDGLQSASERIEEIAKEEENEELKEEEIIPEKRDQDVDIDIIQKKHEAQESDESEQERKEIKKVVKRVSLAKASLKNDADKALNPHVLKLRKKQVISVSREASYSPKLGSSHSSQEPSPNKQI